MGQISDVLCWNVSHCYDIVLGGFWEKFLHKFINDLVQNWLWNPLFNTLCMFWGITCGRLVQIIFISQNGLLDWYILLLFSETYILWRCQKDRHSQVSRNDVKIENRNYFSFCPVLGYNAEVRECTSFQ